PLRTPVGDREAAGRMATLTRKGELREFRLAGETPLDRLRPVEIEPVGQGLRHIELAARDIRAAVDDLREDFAPVEPDVQPDSAREHRMGDSFGRLQERPAARSVAMRPCRPIRRRLRGVITVLRSRYRD